MNIFGSLRYGSALGGVGVVPEGVAFSDLPVLTVDEEFAPLIPGGLAGGLNGPTLGGVHRRGFGGAFGTNGPAVGVRDDMLVSLRHVFLSLSAGLAEPALVCGPGEGAFASQG